MEMTPTSGRMAIRGYLVTIASSGVIAAGAIGDAQIGAVSAGKITSGKQFHPGLAYRPRTTIREFFSHDSWHSIQTRTSYIWCVRLRRLQMRHRSCISATAFPPACRRRLERGVNNAPQLFEMQTDPTCRL